MLSAQLDLIVWLQQHVADKMVELTCKGHGGQLIGFQSGEVLGIEHNMIVIRTQLEYNCNEEILCS